MGPTTTEVGSKADDGGRGNRNGLMGISNIKA